MVNNKKDLASEIRSIYGVGKKLVFVSGNFNVVHPGHLRLFDFAKECGDVLLVGLAQQGHVDVVLSEELRLRSFKQISEVDQSFILPCAADEFIAELKPDVVVKGKEHEKRYNPEADVIESYGGKLLFGSGDFHFSSLDLLRKELEETSDLKLRKPDGFLERHDFSVREIIETLDAIKKMKVVVIGDLIVDEYITCDPIGMSQEDPTLVVSPMRYDKFIGGAGIVAAHAVGLGAQVKYFGVCGEDQTADFAREKLNEYGVDHFLLPDEMRPTSLKQRFRANSKTLLRVSHLRNHDISKKQSDAFYSYILDELSDTDLLVFSDFNYGCLPQELVNRITDHCIENGIMAVADSQASSQIGDISRFKNMTIITPTEREARLAMQDHQSGLVVLADQLQDKTKSENVIITLGAEGVLIHARNSPDDDVVTDRLPAFNTSPKDVAGGGDTFFISTSLSVATGASIWQSAYLGSIAAACQVSTVGNRPISAAQVIKEC